MEEIVKNGFLRLIHTIILFLNEYIKQMDDGILTEKEYTSLKEITNSIYNRLTMEDINKRRDEEIEMLLK